MGTLGIVARELEQNQLTQMLGLVPDDSPPKLVLIKAIFDNSSSPYKAQINAAVDAMLAGPSQEEQAKQQFLEQLATAKLEAELEQIRFQNNKFQSEIVLNLAKAQAQENESETESMKIDIEVQKLFTNLKELQELARQNDAAMLNARANFIKATRGESKANGDQS